MKVERFANKTLNRKGYSWAVKLDTLAEAAELKRQMGIGRGYITKSVTSKHPFWVVAQMHDHYYRVDE